MRISGPSLIDHRMALIQQVQKLRGRDQEVRAHEQAHIAAGAGVVTSGPHYIYQKGPDGRAYAVGGSVGLDSSPVSGDPQATLLKMQKVRAAALAPGEPSGPDLQIAAAAAQNIQKAQAEVREYQKMSRESAAPGSRVNVLA